MSHKLKDCLERPRKVGAKFTGKNIAADEVIHNNRAGLNGLEGYGDYDTKRDRWDGYDPANHKAVVQEHEALEEARRRLREEAIDKGSATIDAKAVKKAAKLGKSSKKKQKDDDDFGSSEESDNGDGAGDDEDKYAEGADVAGQRMDAKTRVTVRNLRIREDTAKYLMNLDPESAYYDPKTRSMREAPDANVKPEDVRFFCCSHSSERSLMLLNDRLSSPEITLHVIQEEPMKFRDYNCLRGNRSSEETMFISIQIPLNLIYFINNSWRRRKS
jgi:pre-mRNA-processing factor SLU7